MVKVKTPRRIPHTESTTEVRQAFQKLQDHFFEESSDVDHDATTNFVATEHIDHSAVSVIAGTGLSGGGTIEQDRTLNVTGSGVDHGALSGLGDDDHTQYLLVNGTRNLTGNLAVDAEVTIDGRDISADGTKLDGIEVAADVTDTANVTAAGAAMAGGVFHDGFSDCVAAEHIDWTSTSSNLVTTGSGKFTNVGISTNPSSVFKCHVYHNVEDAHGYSGIYVESYPQVSTDGYYCNYAMTFIQKPAVASGVTNTGIAAATYGSSLAYSSPAHEGTLSQLYGCYLGYGIYSATGTITSCAGLRLYPYHKTGTITNAYDIKIEAPITGGTVTNQWSIFDLNPARSYLAGPLGLGAIPDARLEVETGTEEGKQAITIDQNDEDQAFIDFQGTSAADATKSISSLTGGNSIQGFAKMEINGTAYWMPYYNVPTS